MPTVNQPGRLQHLFTGLGGLLVAAFFIPMGYHSWNFASECWKRRDCESWPKTTGMIVDANITRTTVTSKHRSLERQYYTVEFEYGYSVNGEVYTGTSDEDSRKNEWESESDFREKLEETGGEVSVSYSPDYPHISTLAPRNSSMLFTLGGLAFTAFFGLFLGGGSLLFGIGHLFRALFPAS